MDSEGRPGDGACAGAATAAVAFENRRPKTRLPPVPAAAASAAAISGTNRLRCSTTCTFDPGLAEGLTTRTQQAVYPGLHCSWAGVATALLLQGVGG